MEKYRKRQKLGEGAFGEAWLVEDKNTNKIYVMKSIKTKKIKADELEAAKAEAETLQSLSHPFIVGYHESFSDSSNFYIVMEYANGGDLDKKIDDQQESGEKFSDSEILKYFVQVLLAVRHLHSHKILHRDLKPQNIFLTSQNIVKLGDFGIARTLADENLAQTMCGTPSYLAPEIGIGQPYNHKADIWSLGVILYQLITLKLPFPLMPMPIYFIQIAAMDYIPLPDETPLYLKVIVDKMLSKNPDDRPDIDDVLAVKDLRVLAFQILEKQIGREKISHNREENRFKQEIMLQTHEIERLQQELRNSGNGRSEDNTVELNRLSNENYELKRENSNLKREIENLKQKLNNNNNNNNNNNYNNNNNNNGRSPRFPPINNSVPLSPPPPPPPSNRKYLNPPNNDLIRQEAEIILDDLNNRYDKIASFAREMIGAKGMKYICENLNKLSNVKILNLALSDTIGEGGDDCDPILLGNDGVKFIFENWHNINEFTCLNFGYATSVPEYSGTFNGDKGLQNLLDNLNELKNLEELYLGLSCVGESGINNLINNFDCLSKLRILDFGNNDIGLSGIHNLCNNLYKLKELKELKLKYPRKVNDSCNKEQALELLQNAKSGLKIVVN